MTTANAEMLEQIKSGQGFIAALDQSGGSTPKALKGYGIEADAFSNDEEMFGLIHAMRSRIVTAPCFNGEKVIGAILFERTMDGDADGKPVPALLWERGVVPFLKVDKGLEDEADGVQLMKANPGLDDLCARAVAKGVFGTKMRSVVNLANPAGIKAIVAQQFAEAKRIKLPKQRRCDGRAHLRSKLRGKFRRQAESTSLLKHQVKTLFHVLSDCTHRLSDVQARTALREL